MCGLYGCIGKGWNVGTFRALVLANEDRGTDSLGFFDSTGKMIKAAVAPSEGLRQKNITAWLERSAEETWFIAGHTRLATRGSVNRRNSHPFRYGRIIGSHNGMVDAPTGYVVDSQYLFDLLAKAKGDYQEAWSKVTGYWGITWFDGQDFYLQAHNGELHYCEYRGCWYYSSSATHLQSCVGHNSTIKKLAEGETLRFSEDGAITTLKPFVSAAPEYWAKKYGASNTTTWFETHKGRKVNRTYATNWEEEDDGYAQVGNVKDYDAEWREAWAKYETSTDEEPADSQRC